MAVVYENTGEVIRLTQTRTGFRVAVYVVGVFWVIGAALMAFMAGHRTETSLVCEAGADGCTLTEGLHVTRLPRAAIVSAKLVRDLDLTVVRIEMDATPRFHAICGASGDAADGQRVVEAIEAARNDASHPAISASCVGRAVAGPNLAIVIPAALAGWLLVLLMTFRFSEGLAW